MRKIYITTLLLISFLSFSASAAKLSTAERAIVRHKLKGMGYSHTQAINYAARMSASFFRVKRI